MTIHTAPSKSEKIRVEDIIGQLDTLFTTPRDVIRQPVPGGVVVLRKSGMANLRRLIIILLNSNGGTCHVQETQGYIRDGRDAIIEEVRDYLKHYADRKGTIRLPLKVTDALEAIDDLIVKEKDRSFTHHIGGGQFEAKIPQGTPLQLVLSRNRYNNGPDKSENYKVNVTQYATEEGRKRVEEWLSKDATNGYMGLYRLTPAENTSKILLGSRPTLQGTHMSAQSS